MSLYDALGAIGGGLRVAGATLSPQFAATASQQDENQKNRDEQKKRFLAELLTQHYQQGTLDAPSYQQAMGKLGMDIPQIQPQPDYSGAASQVTQQLDQGSFLPGGGLRPNATPTAPAARPDGTKPMPVQSVDAKPIGQDELTADIDVPGKVQVYTPEEINLATAKYAESIKGGTIQQRNKAVKDFRDNLKAERKSQLDEMEKASLIKKRDFDMANEKQPAFIKELKYFAKMKPDDPGYKFMLERLTMDSNGKPTAARKNIEADLRSQGLKEGTEQWDEEFHKRMGAYLTKQTTPKAQTGPQDLGEGLGPMAWDALLFGKNPPGMGAASAEQRRIVAKERGRIGHALGLSDVEIAMLPQDNKVKMKAVDKLTTWGAFVDKSSDQLAKTIDIAMAYAERIGPGKLKALNQAIVAGEKHFNDPDANAYALQVNSIRLEYGRLMAGPTSNAMLPVEAMKKGDELISTGFDMPSWKEIKIAVMRDASVTKNAVKGQRDALLGSIKNPGQKEAPQKVDLPGGKGSDVPLHAPEVKNLQGGGTSSWKIEEIK